MRIKFRKGAWILLLTIFAPFIVSTALASESTLPLNGVNVTVYDNNTPFNEYNNAPPVPPTTPIAGTFIQPNIENYFDCCPVFNLYEDFVVKYETNIVLEETASIQFYAPADDGVLMYVDEELIINDWYDKGGGGSISQPIEFISGESRSITLWFYENGGRSLGPTFLA